MRPTLQLIKKQQRHILWALRWPKLSLLYSGGKSGHREGLGMMVWAMTVGLLIFVMATWIDSEDKLLWGLLSLSVVLLALGLYGATVFCLATESLSAREEESTHFFSLSFPETQEAYLRWRKRPLNRMHYLIMIQVVEQLHLLRKEEQSLNQTIQTQVQEEFEQLGRSFLERYVPKAYSTTFSKRNSL